MGLRKLSYSNGDLSFCNYRKNRHCRCSRIAEKNFRQILRYFALDLLASDTARLTGISLRSINSIYIKLREHIAAECEKHSPWSGQIEVDESYFGPRVYAASAGVVQRAKQLYLDYSNAMDGLLPRSFLIKKATLRKVIRGKVAFHSDGWRGYHGLVDMGYAKHLRVNHEDNDFANDQSHINSIESFLAYAKLRLSKMKGIRKNMFYLHLKETEFRFNHRRDNLYRLLMKMLREQPI